ncbi:hypothetical protein D777_00172 [Marinobacter nitratireducens]|uniref:Uncharacterized protein n=1 Tax=Marinobacter nitratireducens TaxID=1137280 RepID=A0A072N647_9GAMM|nr:hypothetical protein [Marinobacter nitratireducens]KEF33164.1 hypothetical protein D777_00172 [Marinobacter nitratireducens]
MSDTWFLVFGLIFTSIGLAYFVYGRKQSNLMARMSGIGLMFFPYLVDDIYVFFGVGIVLMALPKFIEL